MEVYKTTKQELAAYMMMRGAYCVGAVTSLDPTFPDRATFVFTEIENPQALEDSFFRQKKEMMSAKAYFEKLRTARYMAKNPISVEEMRRGRN